MNTNTKNISIGAIICLALACIVGILSFHPSFGDGKQQLHIRFANIEKLYAGSRVTYAGKAIGTISHITLLPESARIQRNGQLYVYDLTLSIDSHYSIYDCDEISLSTSGLMGERFISIQPRLPTPSQPARILDGDELIFAEQPLSTEDVFSQIHNTAVKAEEAITAFADILTISSPHVKIATENFAYVSKDLRTIMANISSGESSLGKLATSGDFYTKTTSILNKVDQLMQDVNQYGFLFHLDKSWLRERKRRVEELEAIQSPQDLKTYLQTEVVKVNNSLIRLQKASEKAKATHSTEEYLAVCSELATQLSELQSRLKETGIQTEEIIAEE